MATSHLALGFLFLTLLATPPLLLVHGSNELFDFFYFVLLWPGAYCAQSKCCLPNTGVAPAVDFYVQSFQTWNATTDKAETRCYSDPFDFDQLDALKDKLYAYWSNIGCPSNNGRNSWKSAWKKYGTCSGLWEYDYFKAALDLRARVDALSLLTNKGIVPTTSKKYSVSTITQAIADGIGATPLIRCSYQRNTTQFQLYQIYICVDSDAKTIIECPIEQRFTCSDEILFLPFNTNQLNTTKTTLTITTATTAATTTSRFSSISIE